jgi:hypothetical protein
MQEIRSRAIGGASLLFLLMLNGCTCSDTDTLKQIHDQATAATITKDDCMPASAAHCETIRETLAAIADASGKLVQGR